MQALRSSIARSCPSAAVGGAISRPASAPLRLLSTAPALRFAQAVGTGPAGSNSGTAKQDAQLAEDLAHAKQEMIKLGFNEESFWVQTICWGDHDQFQHVNNCHYIRFLESQRMRFAEVVTEELGPQRQQEIVRGTGKGMILGSIAVRYRRPVVYPDTLLVASAPDLPMGKDRFNLRAAMYSLKQKTVVATADQLCVTYDYKALAKCDMPEDWKVALEKRGRPKEQK